MNEFLSKAGVGRKIVRVKKKSNLFNQGEASDCVFYLQSGRAKVTVVSRLGKEATITLVASGHFLGEDAIPTPGARRIASATALSNCVAMRIERDEMIRVIHDENKFSDFFVRFLLARGLRTQADLIDQLFNSSEKRLARTLLLMAEFGKLDQDKTLIPKITQETLAEMIGTTRSRVSFFMNRFRDLGFIEYKSRIRIHRSLLNVVLNDKFPDHNAVKPKTVELKP